MTAIDVQLAEDRALRDAARRLLDADLAFIREDLSQRSAGGRIADRAIDAALDTTDDALNYARNHAAVLLGITAAVGAWLARRPICKGVKALRNKAEHTFQ